MVSVVNNTTMVDLLKIFSDRLWECIKDKGDEQRRMYDEKVSELIMLMVPVETNSKKTSMKDCKNKPKIPIPFCGIVENGWCCGIKKNHGLYTQCMKPRPNGGVYCKICLKQSKNNANGKPNCGDIRDRATQWDGELSYKPPGMTQEVPYANVVSKLNLDLSEARDIVDNLGWGEIPDVHLIEKKRKRGRPKTKIVVEDSDDECPKRGRGRPKKIVKELTDEELIAQYMESIMC